MISRIYHNPDCGTSRNTLAIMHASQQAPQVIEYMTTPPDRPTLVRLLADMNMAPRELLRQKESVYTTLGLDDPMLSDEHLIDAMLANPVLINRPIVVTPRGTRLCRPSEAVMPLLDTPVTSFTKEDGDTIVFPSAP
ncbi:arsenate reductase (glutaredoxin) [Larsenimonas rhizosphaerae]|uniref:Arsenate reductase n=1 Tax=Larsenimonas rhizosphaerae TaxID=2944682 RepID=A0AA42CU37_9GAMM|nr:arsenate reductase (glutaredoxin) [Larsenimonas rhizosphaerae]MCX2524242.1 arsenate reductase (glutaredoxin) [Larsenimonas rhizosphaerae]